MYMKQNLSNALLVLIWLFGFICELLFWFFSYIYFSVYLPDALYAQ